MATIPQLTEISSITPGDVLIAHDLESNTTRRISGANSQKSFHRFGQIIVSAGNITLSPEHETSVVVLTNVTSTVVNINNDIFEQGATIHLLRDNSAGPVTVQALGGSTVVLRVASGKLSQARDVNSPMTLYLREKGATEYWNIWGDLKDV